MKKAEMIFYLFWIFFAILGIFVLIPQYVPEYSDGGISPRTLPYIWCTVILICAVLVVLRLYKQKDLKADLKENPLPLKKWLHLAIYGIVMFSAFPLMELIHFIPASIIILGILQFLAGQRNIVLLCVVSVITAVSVWALMRFVLSVPLP